jgi:large subunit ribosomal protein L2
MNRVTYTSQLNFHKIIATLVHIERLTPTIKPLTSSLKNKGGRSRGHIVMPRRGAYRTRIHRFIDFKRYILPKQKGLVLRHDYNPNGSADVSLICYPLGIIAYILKPIHLEVGQVIVNLATLPINYGDSAYIADLPSGALIHNIDRVFIRSAGCSAILVRKDLNQALLKLKSGELRFFHISMIASFGTVGNENHFLRDYKYAGVMRRLGQRPRTRACSMNPVDHPLGGRTRGGAQPVNIKGIITLNRKTVHQHHPAILYTKRQLKLLRQ